MDRVRHCRIRRRLLRGRRLRTEERFQDLAIMTSVDLMIAKALFPASQLQRPVMAAVSRLIADT
jgi:hypothetical protein